MASKAVGTLAVNLVARTRKFTAGLAKARRDMKKFGAGTRKSSAMLAAFGRAARVAAAAGLAAMTAGIIKTISIAEQFDRAMNRSIAIMGKLGKQMRATMETAALDVAAVMKVTAKEAAESFFFLASAGFDAAQSILALPTVATFAQAGMFDMALATDLLTDAQSALGLSVKNVAQNMLNLKRVGDVLVKANTLANASVQQFSEALTNKAAAAARFLGKDIEETIAVLAVMADQGLKSAEAGTAFSIAMREFGNKSILNKKKFDKLGISVFDLNGKMLHTADIVASLERVLGGLSTRLQVTRLLQAGFNQKSIDAIKILIGTSEKIRDNDAALRDAGGTMKEVADKQLTKFEKATAKIGVAAAKIGKKFKDAVTPAVVAFGEAIERVFNPKAENTSSVITAIQERAAARGLGPRLGSSIQEDLKRNDKLQDKLTDKIASLKKINERELKLDKNIFDPFGTADSPRKAKIETRKKEISSLLRDFTKLNTERRALLAQLDRANKQSDAQRAIADTGVRLGGVLGRAAGGSFNDLFGKTVGQLAPSALNSLGKQFGTLTKGTDGIGKFFANIKEGQRVTISVMTPLENFAKTLKDLDRLKSVGAITGKTFQRAVAQANARLELTTPAAQPAPIGRNSAGAALLRGSSEAFSATNFAKRGDDPIKKVEKNTKKSLVIEKKSRDILSDILVAIKQGAGPIRDLIPGAGG